MNDFYSSGKGDKLITEQNYPEEIVEFLEKEKKNLKKVLNSKKYESLIEVGCMDGRAVTLAVSNNITYIGVDIVERYIKEAKRKYSNWQTKKEIKFICCDSADIPKKCKIKLPGLASFPFNSLGNHTDPKKSLEAISKSKLDIIIFTYQTDNQTREIRRRYYENCNYNNLTFKETKKGDEFSAEEGLCTIAFSESYLKNTLEGLFDNVNITKFSKIGLMAYCFNRGG